MKTDHCKKLFLAVGFICMCMAQFPAYAISTTETTAHIPVIMSSSGISPYADKIILRTRIHNGITQYRHWNETKGCWVEPDWIDLP